MVLFRGYKELQGATRGLQGIARDFRGLQRVTGVTGVYVTLVPWGKFYFSQDFCFELCGRPCQLHGKKWRVDSLVLFTASFERSPPQLRFLRKKVVVSSSYNCHFVAGALACSAGVFYGRANVLFAKAHVETRKEGRKWGESPTLRVTIFTLLNLSPS